MRMAFCPLFVTLEMAFASVSWCGTVRALGYSEEHADPQIFNRFR